MTEDYVVVGRVGRPHGIKGELSVEPRTDEPDRRFASGAVLDVHAPRVDAPAQVQVEAARWHQGRLLVRFEGMGDRTSAEEARGWELRVPIDPADVPAGEEEFYDHQLVGLEVHDTDGVRRGTVTAVLHGGAQDLLRIDADGREVLVPFVTALVPTVDLSGGRLVVADRPGLLDGEPS